MKQIHDWLEHKLSGNYTYLKETVTVTHTYHKHTGPRYIYGQVTLVAEPAEEFSFTSQVTWPEDAG